MRDLVEQIKALTDLVDKHGGDLDTMYPSPNLVQVPPGQTFVQDDTLYTSFGGGRYMDVKTGEVVDDPSIGLRKNFLFSDTLTRETPSDSSSGNINKRSKDARRSRQERKRHDRMKAKQRRQRSGKR